MMELLERDLVKRLEKRYGHGVTVRKADETTQSRRNGPKEVPQRRPDQVVRDADEVTVATLTRDLLLK